MKKIILSFIITTLFFSLSFAAEPLSKKYLEYFFSGPAGIKSAEIFDKIYKEFNYEMKLTEMLIIAGYDEMAEQVDPLMKKEGVIESISEYCDDKDKEFKNEEERKKWLHERFVIMDRVHFYYRGYLLGFHESFKKQYDRNKEGAEPAILKQFKKWKNMQ